MCALRRMTAWQCNHGGYLGFWGVCVYVCAFCECMTFCARVCMKTALLKQLTRAYSEWVKEKDMVLEAY